MKRFDEPIGAGDEAPIVYWEFRREQVEQNDISDFLLKFGEPLNADLPPKTQGTFHIAVAGYDDDKREISEIPEVRAFYTNFHEVWPYWLFFVEVESLRTMMYCVLKKFGVIALLIPHLVLAPVRNPTAMQRR
jgi:hypothetical protein